MARSGHRFGSRSRLSLRFDLRGWPPSPWLWCLFCPGRHRAVRAAFQLSILNSPVASRTCRWPGGFPALRLQHPLLPAAYRSSGCRGRDAPHPSRALLELIAERGDGLSDIPQLAEHLQLEVDDLLPLLDAAVLLGFAEVADGVVRLSPIGSDFATTTILRSKDLFRQQALQRIPVLSSIVQTLQEKANGSMKSDFFLGIWDDYFPLEEAERQLATAVDWGRYAELFEFNAGEGRLTLPD